MITIETENCNLISQNFYNKIILSLDLHRISCTCGHSACLIWYGHYTRKVQLPHKIISLTISRVYCQACGRTHAILLASMVPYSQIPLAVHVATALSFEAHTGYHSILDSQLFIDENNILFLIRNYRRHWRQRLLSNSLSVTLPDLIHGCFFLFSRQFMQIKTTPNKLFHLPT